jgi:phosphohistidine swiveling domain-containing protein
VGTLLARGRRGFGGFRTGRVVHAADASEARRRLARDGTEILVTRMLTPEHLPLLPGLAGLVLEELSAIGPAEIAAAAPGLVAVGGVPEGMRHLEDGATVTLHGDGYAVYEGVVPEASSAT